MGCSFFKESKKETNCGSYLISSGEAAAGERREDMTYKKMKYFEYKNYYPECKTLGDYDKVGKTITVIVPEEFFKQKPTRWPKEFERVTAQKVRLKGSNVFIYQWNTGKKKNFLVEKIGLPLHQQNTWAIPGYGNEAMKLAIEKARSLA